jgi:SAM-dependent methyltransferase
MLNSNSKIWDNHYKKEKSKLFYPDENLVRILSKLNGKGFALDHGSGSGRHIPLLKNFGYEVKACDYSISSVENLRKDFSEIEISQIESTNLPYQENEFDLLISWGVLHYNSFEDTKKIVKEWKRILKDNSYLAFTVRANTDTHLVLQKDLEGSKIKLYSLEELKTILDGFKEFEIAYMERTPLGKLEQRISHWIILAKN